jgi:ABC-type dipeptide/oligopeptide/nickel transport system ATPase component
MAESVPEIRLALFGRSGSGKTTLLSSYFGNQQRNSFEESHGYHLEAEDPSVGNQLLSRYYQMEKSGSFPLGTESFLKYTFAFKVHGLTSPSLRIVWYDYPGGWWERHLVMLKRITHESKRSRNC